MEIVYETNGKAFLGWIVELPGAYIRGKTLDEARNKINGEITAYQKWLDLQVKNEIITKEKIVQCNLMVEDADSDVLLMYDTIEYRNIDEFKSDCEFVLLSSRKVAAIYKKCKNKNVIDKTKLRKTFYGDEFPTIEGQYNHNVDVQRYYLNMIETDADIGTGIHYKGNISEIIEGRIKTVEAIKEKYLKDGNKLYKRPEEEWTIRKVMRRLIWHDRFHAMAIEEMEKRLTEDKNGLI
jgi:predicted RNase H-like HicB family nuclease